MKTRLQFTVICGLAIIGCGSPGGEENRLANETHSSSNFKRFFLRSYTIQRNSGANTLIVEGVSCGEFKLFPLSTNQGDAIARMELKGRACEINSDTTRIQFAELGKAALRPFILTNVIVSQN